MSASSQFDQLSEHFADKIYNSDKGRIRLALLQRDLENIRQRQPMTILDAGGGQGHMSRWFAGAGHQLDLFDASKEMLAKADLLNKDAGLSNNIELHHSTIEQFCQSRKDQYQMLLCHAVLEWLEDPFTLLNNLLDHLSPGGTLSLMFYNQHSLVLRNALRGNLRKVKRADWRGDGQGLTPYQPIAPDHIYAELSAAGLTINQLSGIRCFYDYLPVKVRQTYEFDDILELEIDHYRQQPYIHMARYIHVIATKSAE